MAPAAPAATGDGGARAPIWRAGGCEGGACILPAAGHLAAAAATVHEVFSDTNTVFEHVSWQERTLK